MSFVVAEFVHVFHLAAWFTGIVVLIGGPVFAIYWVATCDVLGQEMEEFQRAQGESSSYMLDPRVDIDHGQKSTVDILDECLTYRAKLQYFHRILCERAGVEPGSHVPLEDLIGEAVFDGRRISHCIYELQTKESQHA